METIDFQVKDSVAVFTIKKESDLELKIYNPEYFHSIGFDNVEIELVKDQVADEIQKGGAYSKEEYEKLTIPFKYFVYAVQGEGKTEAELEADKVVTEVVEEPVVEEEPIVEETAEDKKEPVVEEKHGDKAEPGAKKSWFGALFDRFKFKKEETEQPKVETEQPKVETEQPKEEPGGLFSMFKKKEEPKQEVKDETKVETPVETKVETPVETKVETPVETKVETPVETQAEAAVLPPPPQNEKWIIKIPLTIPPHCLGNNIYEIEECQFIERLKQIKRQRDVGVVIKDATLYDVGRPLYLGKVVPDEKIEWKSDNTLPGTLLDKYNRKQWL